MGSSIRPPPAPRLSNHSPRLTIRWDLVRLGISGEEVTRILFNTEPRIALSGGGGPGRGETAIEFAAGASDQTLYGLSPPFGLSLFCEPASARLLQAIRELAPRRCGGGAR